MENVLLIILLLLALALIGVVLMQRSEGGGLGMGGGGGGGGLTSGRGAATALSKVTWVIATAFLALCVVMTVLAARETGNSSVLDRLGTERTAPAESDSGTDLLPPGLQGDLLPPAVDGGVDLPPAAD